MNKFHKNDFNDKSFICNYYFSHRLFFFSFKLINADVLILFLLFIISSYHCL